MSERGVHAPPRAALWALVPLAVIVLGFVTPPVLLHRTYRVVPLAPVSDDLGFRWWFHASALVLGLVTLFHARRRSEPRTPSVVIAGIATAGALWLPILTVYAAGVEEPVYAIASAAVVGVAIAGMTVAFRIRGWRGWLAALGAWAVAALPYGCAVWMGAFNEFSGGVTFAIADVTLVALAVLGLRR